MLSMRFFRHNPGKLKMAEIRHKIVVPAYAGVNLVMFSPFHRDFMTFDF